MTVRQFMIRLTFCVGLALLAGSTAAGETTAASSGFHFPATGIRVDEQAILLAIDDVSLPLKENVCYYLSKPKVRKEPVLGPSRDDPTAPDHLAAHFYGSVLYDEGKFRMWYYPVSFGKDFTELTQGPVCYAEAAERGVTKPYDQVHLGVAGTSLGNVVVGLYGLWHNYPGDRSRNVPASWFGHEKTSCDLGLVVSNDGIHFREPVKGHVYISRFDSAVTAG